MRTLMDKPRLLDLFCKAGGCTRGYQQAGFYVVGVDIEAQPHYIGDEFCQGDALEYLATHGHEFDLIHASPPCQRYSNETPERYRDNHPDLLPVVARILQGLGKPYVIENIPTARHLLTNPLMLCGSMFGLNIRRHRYFETSPILWFPPQPCEHGPKPVLITGTTRRTTGRFEYSVAACKEASGIDWMTRKELDEAIPPAYTQWIGEQMMGMVFA